MAQVASLFRHVDRREGALRAREQRGFLQGAVAPACRGKAVSMRSAGKLRPLHGSKRSIHLQPLRKIVKRHEFIHK